MFIKNKTSQSNKRNNLKLVFTIGTIELTAITKCQTKYFKFSF